MSTLLEIIVKEWGWTGINPKEILDINKFGNLIIKDTAGVVWRLIPENLSCSVIASGVEEYEKLKMSSEFLLDWHMESLVEMAEIKYGKQNGGTVFHLVQPAPLGGEYDISNIDVVPLEEAIALSGSIAYQIKDLSDGEAVRIQVVE